ncbi:MAG: protein-tyrosine-phosphatase [Enterobacterales bacterium]|jgi:protein-tyrosine-phosphatase
MSIHFGMYLFVDVGNTLQSPLAIKILEHIVSKQSEHEKLLIFSGNEIKLPKQMSSNFTAIKHKVAAENSTATNTSLLAS